MSLVLRHKPEEIGLQVNSVIDVISNPEPAPDPYR